jgi:hypothetical protein
MILAGNIIFDMQTRLAFHRTWRAGISLALDGKAVPAASPLAC